MKPKDRALSLLVAMFFVGLSGCMENIALIGRPTISEGQSDIVGEVERVDPSSRRIYLRPGRSGARVASYSADAQVLYRGREYPVARLEPGDVVVMQMKRDSRGDSYTDLIRVQEHVSDQGRDVSTSAPRIQTLSGSVERINFRGTSFDLDDQLGQPVSVILSENARFRSGAFPNSPGRRSRENRR